MRSLRLASNPSRTPARVFLLVGVCLVATCSGKTEVNRYYYRDSKRAYFVADAAGSEGCSLHYETIGGAEPNTFRACGDGRFAFDRRKAYWSGKPIANADGASFRCVSGDTASAVGLHPAVAEHVGRDSYARDAHAVYFEGAVLEGATPATFRVTDETAYATDGRVVYFAGRPLQADAKSFHTSKRSHYAWDREHVFFAGVNLPGERGATFQELGDGYARGAAVYYQGKALAGARAATFGEVKSVNRPCANCAIYGDGERSFLYGSPYVQGSTFKQP